METVLVLLGIVLVIFVFALRNAPATKTLQSAKGRPRRSMAPSDVPLPPSPLKGPLVVMGQLKHKRIYMTAKIKGYYGLRYHSTCPVCLAEFQSVLSEAVDSNGSTVRCCLRCLLKYGGKNELEAAAKRSKYARRVTTCVEALNQLCDEFPDPARRPYGGPTLLEEISQPSIGMRTDADRIIEKIKARKWNEYDLARIEGRPEPSGDSKTVSPPNERGMAASD